MIEKKSLEQLERVSVETFKQLPKTPLVLILDNIRSALNVGAAFRTADAFLVQELALCGITAVPPHREILKTAIGATESMNWQYFENTTQAITHYRNKGFKIVGVEQTQNSIPLQNFDTKSLNAPLALIFGNEVGGVEQEAIEACDACIEIPQYGTKHSLNIAVCLGIVVWELFIKLRANS